LRETLVDHVGPTITRSDAEDRFLEIIEEAGLARPKVNYWIPLDGGSGYRPEFLWPFDRPDAVAAEIQRLLAAASRKTAA
jgi:hypothetical protein